MLNGLEEIKASKKLKQLLTIIREETEKLKQTILEIRKEREQLEYIKSQLEDTSPKIDISNVYIFQNRGIRYIVRYEATYAGEKINVNGSKMNEWNHSQLINIFNGKKIYEEIRVGKLKIEIKIDKSSNYNLLGETYSAYLIPIVEAAPNLLAYSNQLVPLYILEQLNYNLNNIDVKSLILQKLPQNEKVNTK